MRTVTYQDDEADLVLDMLQQRVTLLTNGGERQSDDCKLARRALDSMTGSKAAEERAVQSPLAPVHFWYENRGSGSVLCDYGEPAPETIRCVTRTVGRVTCADCWEGLK